MNKVIRTLVKKRYSFYVQISWLKIICWFFWLWLLVGFFISATTTSNKINTSYESFKGDHGVLILITILVALFIPLLMQGTRNDTLIGGFLIWILSLITFAGTLVTKPTPDTVAVWTVPLFFLIITGWIWFLIGWGVIEVSWPRKNLINDRHQIKDSDSKKKTETFKF